MIATVCELRYDVTIDYSQSLREMILDGRYNWVNPAIRPEHFSIQGQGVKDLHISIFTFSKPMSREEAERGLKKKKFRLARIEELLAIGKSWPDLQRKLTIIGLGSVYYDLKRMPFVPALSKDKRERILDLFLAGAKTKWRSGCGFAAVPLNNR